MPRPTPIVVRLPLAFARGRVTLSEILDLGRGDVRREIAAFTLTRRERRFVKWLALDHGRFWIYRTDQRARAGDFAIVDMSSPWPDRRRLWVVDLKMGAPIKLGGGGAGIQLSRHGDAVDALVREGVVGRVRPVLAVGDGKRLAELVSRPPRRAW